MINRARLIDWYYDWLNNYLTVEVFAEHHGFTPDEARALLVLAKHIAERNHPDQ